MATKKQMEDARAKVEATKKVAQDAARKLAEYAQRMVDDPTEAAAMGMGRWADLACKASATWSLACDDLQDLAEELREECGIERPCFDEEDEGEDD